MSRNCPSHTRTQASSRRRAEPLAARWCRVEPEVVEHHPVEGLEGGLCLPQHGADLFVDRRDVAFETARAHLGSMIRVARLRSPPPATYHCAVVAARTYRAEAIVLKTNDFAEADRILVLFTRHFGKVRVVAKGIRRATSRMAGHAEPLTHATYQLARGRELDVLTGAEARAIYPDMRDDLALIAAGWYVAELVDRFTADRVPSAPLFDLLETSLRALDAGIHAPTVCRWFDLHLLDRSGFRPELGVCAQCRTALAEVTNAWEPAAGGAICAGCASRLPYAAALTVRGLKSLRYLLVSDPAAASRLRLDVGLARELDRHLRGFLRYVLDRDIATSHLLDELCDLRRPAPVS